MKAYITFVKISQTDKTEVYAVRSVKHGFNLGVIRFYFGWRQYVFEPETQSIWNNLCLDAVSEFLKKLNKEHKARLLREREESC